MPHHTSDQMQECIDRCQACQSACLESISHCLEKGGRHAAAEHIRLLVACAEICDTSARFMLIGSPQHSRVCEVCAEVCDACARDCDAFGEDALMQQCAEACRRCAESCRQMSMSRA